MNLGLKNKVAIVTGASRGIGLATVKALEQEGVKVFGAARTLTPELLALNSTGVLWGSECSRPSGPPAPKFVNDYRLQDWHKQPRFIFSCVADSGSRSRNASHEQVFDPPEGR